MPKKRVAAYCRVSTEMEMQEDSLRLQQDWFLFAYANHPDMELVGVYADDRSGTDTESRPGLCRMLNDCADGKIDQIVVKSVSRLSRNMADFLSVVRLLARLRVAVIFEAEGLNTLEERGEMILSVLAAVAQEEVNALSRNLAWAVRQRDASGHPDYRVSYGFRKDEETRGWLICEQEAQRVRTAFQKAADGLTYRELSAYMGRLEADDPTGANWTHHRLHCIFTNIHYIGDILTQKTYVPDYLNHKRVRNLGALDRYYLQDHHPAIISRELFKQVNDRIAAGLLRSNRKEASA